MASNEMLGAVIEEVLEELEDLPSRNEPMPRDCSSRLRWLPCLLPRSCFGRDARLHRAEVATDSAGLTDTGAASPS